MGQTSSSSGSRESSSSSSSFVKASGMTMGPRDQENVGPNVEPRYGNPVKSKILRLDSRGGGGGFVHSKSKQVQQQQFVEQPTTTNAVMMMQQQQSETIVMKKGKRPPKDPNLSVEERLARAMAEHENLQAKRHAPSNSLPETTTSSLVDMANRISVMPSRRLKARAPSSTPSDTKSYSSCGGSSTNSDEMREPVNLRSFELIKVLGKGSHGKVYLVRHKGSKQYYAMKQLKKADVARTKQVENTKRELKVHVELAQQEIRCPYIVPLRFAFHSRSRLYMVFDFMAGGELYFHIGQRGKLPEALGRFYAAEIALALGYLHANGIVYRDLKPENLLLDQAGHIHLVDFGLCKDNMRSATQGSNSFCGTTEYLAPEILQYKQHGMAVDWWSFGMVLYEMLTGLPPWYSYKQEEVVQGILGGELRFPSYLSNETVDLIQRLLNRDPARRLGSTSDVDEIIAHPFFKDVDWVQLAARNIRPPFAPPNEGLACNFDTEFTNSRLEGEQDYLPPRPDDPFTGFYFDSEDPVTSSMPLDFI